MIDQDGMLKYLSEKMPAKNLPAVPTSCFLHPDLWKAFIEEQDRGNTQCKVSFWPVSQANSNVTGDLIVKMERFLSLCFHECSHLLFALWFHQWNIKTDPVKRWNPGLCTCRM